MDVVGDDEGHQVLATEASFASVVLDGFRQVATVVDVAEHLKRVALGDEAVLATAGQQVSTGNVVVDAADHSTAVAGRQDVFLHAHEDLGFSTGFLRLNDVEVHLVTVEVSVVGRTHSEVEPEGLAFHDAHLVHHHGHPVQRWLPVEDGDVAVDQVALNGDTGLRVAAPVHGRKTVVHTGVVAPLIGRGAAVRAEHVEVLGEGLRIRRIGLAELPLPALVQDATGVVVGQRRSVVFFAAEVRQGSLVVHAVLGEFVTGLRAHDEGLDDQAWQEVGRRHDRVEVRAQGALRVALGVEATESSVDEAAALVDTNTTTVATDDVVHTGVDVGATKDHLTHVLTVSRGHADGHREFLGDAGRHADFVDAEEGVGRNDRASTEVHTLSGQVGTEATFLPLQALSERLEGTARAVACGGNARSLVVEVGGAVVLQQFPQVLNDELRRTGVTVLSEALVDAKDVHELVGQVVLGAVAAVQGDGRADGDRRHGEHLEHDPLGAVGLVHPDEDEVLIRNGGQPFAHVAGVELALGFLAAAGCSDLFLEVRWLLQDDLALGLSAVHARLALGTGGHLLDVLDDLREFGRTDTVLGDDVVDAVAVVVLFREFGVRRVRSHGVVEQDAVAGVAGGLQRGLDQVHEPDVNDREFKRDVPEVTRAFVVLAVVRGADHAGLDDTHVRVHETLGVGVTVVLVGVRGLDLDRRHLADLGRVHQAEAD